MKSVTQFMKDNWWAPLTLSLVLCLILAMLTGPRKPSPPAEATQDPSGIDTFIPAGMVLVPIEVYNYESLDSVLGTYGVVDLFPVSPQGQRMEQAAARRVKIVRAPKNPSQFAVLVPDDQAPRLVQAATPFYVVIQNPKVHGTQFERRSKTTQIIYEGG